MSLFASLRQWFKNPGTFFEVPDLPGFNLPIPVLGLWYCGIWPMGRTWKSKMYITLSYIITTITVFGEILLCLKVWGDIGSMCAILSSCIEGTRAILVCFHFVWKGKELADVIIKFSSEIWISREGDEKVYLAAEKNTSFSNCVSAALFLAMFSRCIIPYLSTMNSPPEQKRFPFELHFPFPYRHPVSYHLLFFFGIHSGWVCVFCIIAHDSLLSYILIYICAQFQRLCQRITEIGVDNVEDEVVQEALTGAVEEHNRLIEFVYQVEDLFSPNILIQFVVKSLLVCVLGIQILFVPEPLATIIESVLFFITSLGQLYCICHSGQQLIDCSNQVADAAYNFNWMYVNRKFHTNVLMIMQRSQSPLQITAYKFFSLSMESFCSICSTAGSYFALLKQLMEE